MSWLITGKQKVFTWDAREDLLNSLSATRTNPNGVWSYGRMPSLSSTSLTLVTQSISTGWQDSVGGANFNTPLFTVSSVDAKILSHPPIAVSGTTAAIRWIAPFSCNLSIDSSIEKTETLGNGVVFAVYQNATALFTGTAINGPTGFSSYTGTTTVSTGDFIDFKVSNNGISTNDVFNYTKILLTGTV